MCDMAAWVGKMSRHQIEVVGQECARFSNKDATGVALYTGKNVHVMKAPGSSHWFFNQSVWKKSHKKFEPYIKAGLIHARMATDGTPKDNRNNHPHMSPKGSVLTHKGMVKEIKKYKIDSECDSAQILMSLDDKGLKEGIKNITGWASVFYMPASEPDMLWMFSGSKSISILETEDYTLFNTLDHGSKKLPMDKWYGINMRTGETQWGPKVILYTQNVSARTFRPSTKFPSSYNQSSKSTATIIAKSASQGSKKATGQGSSAQPQYTSTSNGSTPKSE